jgi:hypothetical protein
MPRQDDGTMNGKDCLLGPTELYVVAGALRTQLMALIEAEKARTPK